MSPFQFVPKVCSSGSRIYFFVCGVSFNTLSWGRKKWKSVSEKVGKLLGKSMRIKTTILTMLEFLMTIMYEIRREEVFSDNDLQGKNLNTHTQMEIYTNTLTHTLYLSLPISPTATVQGLYTQTDTKSQIHTYTPHPITNITITMT